MANLGELAPVGTGRAVPLATVDVPSAVGKALVVEGLEVVGATLVVTVAPLQDGAEAPVQLPNPAPLSISSESNGCEAKTYPFGSQHRRNLTSSRSNRIANSIRLRTYLLSLARMNPSGAREFDAPRSRCSTTLSTRSINRERAVGVAG